MSKTASSSLALREAKRIKEKNFEREEFTVNVAGKACRRMSSSQASKHG